MALTDKLTAIANAIRAKTGGTATMTLAEMPTEIASIQTGITPSGSITLTSENTYDVTEKASAVVDFSATRANLAEAVTAKGVDTLPTSSFDTIATNIGLISGGGGSNLPSEYQEVAYIMSNTHQYIDTGLFGGNIKIEIEFGLSTAGDDQSVFGSMIDSSVRGFGFTWYKNKWYFARGAEAQGNANGTWIKSQKLIYNDENSNILLDDNIIGAFSGSPTTANSIVLFARRNQNGVVGTYSNMILNSWKVTDKTTNAIIQNLIPCYRKIDGEAGLFDTISNQFLTNSGDTAYKFIVGFAVKS